MLEKIKSWNWPVIWSVLTPALFALLWLIISSLFNGLLNLPEYEAARTAATASNDTMYGVFLTMHAGCWVTAIVFIWKFFGRCWDLLDRKPKRKK